MTEGLSPPMRNHVKADWKLPSVPRCVSCSREAIPTAVDTGEGWTLGWECPRCGPDYFAWDDGSPGVGVAPEWPFEFDIASGGDFLAIGFQVM